MQAMLYHHFLSYDMNIRPTVTFHIPPMFDLLAELSVNTFYSLSGFWPDQFTEVKEMFVYGHAAQHQSP
jgi:hypothetical protein